MVAAEATGHLVGDAVEDVERRVVQSGERHADRSSSPASEGHDRRAALEWSSFGALRRGVER